MKPWLLWAGSKRGIAESIAAEIVAVKPKLYVEPFLGSGAVALALPATMPKTLADANPVLMDCWRCVRDVPELLNEQLRDVETKYGNDLDGYLDARVEFNKLVHHTRPMWARRSALFLYLNARCFNGLWRVNRSGYFNVPFGKRPKPKSLTLDELLIYSAAIKITSLQSWFYYRTLDAVEKTSFANRTAIYVDPPYDGTFDGYAKDGFGEPDQRELAAQLQRLAERGTSVWASNADTPLIREIYAWAQIESVDEWHGIGATSARRGDRSCVLIRGGGAQR